MIGRGTRFLLEGRRDEHGREKEKVIKRERKKKGIQRGANNRREDRRRTRREESLRRVDPLVTVCFRFYILYLSFFFLSFV